MTNAELWYTECPLCGEFNTKFKKCNVALTKPRLYKGRCVKYFYNQNKRRKY